VAVKSLSDECNITVWLLSNLFILLVKHGGRVVLSVSNRNQFVLSVTCSHNTANHFSIMGHDSPVIQCCIGDILSEHNKWENLASANMKYWEVQKIEDGRKQEEYA